MNLKGPLNLHLKITHLHHMKNSKVNPKIANKFPITASIKIDVHLINCLHCYEKLLQSIHILPLF